MWSSIPSSHKTFSMKHLLLFMFLPALCFGQEAKLIAPTQPAAIHTAAAQPAVIRPLTSPPGFSIPGADIQAVAANQDSGVVEGPDTDTSGSSELDSIGNGDWMNYGVYVTSAGTYAASFRVATAGPGASLELVDFNTGAVLDTVYLPNTGGLTNWQTVTAYVNLPISGLVELRVLSTSATDWAFNWMDFAVPGTPPPSQAQPIPGMIQAESYFAMSGVATQPTTDSAGGVNVGWIDNQDWMNYRIYVDSAGTYLAGFRVATPYANASFEVLDNNGSVLANVNVPNTGGFQSWQTVTVPIRLKRGGDTLWIESTSWDIWNFNWMQFTPMADSAAGAAAIPGKAVDSAFFANTTLWPNPVRDVFTIQMEDTLAGKLAVQVADGSGVVRLVMNGVKTPGANQFTIPAGRLLPGVYFVRIMVGDRLQVRKVLKL
jgi:Carbohydrate binding module (family 6)/Secretion system C-terminal sorting domain